MAFANILITFLQKKKYVYNSYSFGNVLWHKHLSYTAFYCQLSEGRPYSYLFVCEWVLHVQ